MSIDVPALLTGAKAECGDCGTALSIEPGESARSAMERFEAARDEVQQVIGGRKLRG
jgi:hypothetical protein